jgi:uncharacterized protein YbjT (DUF2867 family)
VSEQDLVVLVVGATGSIGRLAVAEALRRGYETRALVRNPKAAASLAAGVQLFVGDLTEPETLSEALAGADAIVFTHGTHGAAEDAREVDYGAVRNILGVLDGRRVRIALMTSIGVTNRGSYAPHDWKRRGERLVRASGLPYTIVRPGWFDYNAPDQRRLVMLQGDRRRTGTPKDGAVSREQIAQVLVASVSAGAADHKTLELIAEQGPGQADLEPLFSALRPDAAGGLDGVEDDANMPLDAEPEEFTRDLDAVRRTYTYLAIQEAADGRTAEWMEHVRDEQYLGGSADS